MTIDIRTIPRDRLPEFLVPISVVFGLVVTPERVGRVRGVDELDTLLGACDGDTIVGTAGAFDFEMTVPGGAAVETSGLTLVAVMPTHRRQGLLRRMMRMHLDEAHRRGQAVAALYASEGGIYGRFGYGMAALRGDIELRKERARFITTAPREGDTHEGDARVRLLTEEEAAAALPVVWERVRRVRPGMLSRSASWWRTRRLPDPEWLRAGRPPLQRVLLEIDGRPAAYALYRYGGTMKAGPPEVPLDVMECLGDSPAATRAIWQYLFDLDLVQTYRAALLPADHPLVFTLAEPGRLSLRLQDGLWVRLVDVGAALSARGYGAGEPLVIDVADDFCPWNAGRWRLADGVARRTEGEPDLAMDVAALGAAYLGGFTFSQLAHAGRVTERSPGAIERADAMFRASLLPWCPEIF
jgi:predicted acetyltransferase